MAYRDLREFITQLETLGELRRVSQPVSPMLEMTAVCDRALRAGGPALLFTNPGSAVGDIRSSAIKIAQPRTSAMPVLGNLFGTPRRVALAMGSALQAAGGDPAHPREGLRKLGQLLAQLKEPQPPKGLLNMLSFGVNLLKSGLQSAPRELGSAPCQEIVWQGSEVDLGRLPVQTCWPP
jgi:4-hydroxy-3-polyprenylbenzoate decarboxylase